MEKIHYKRHLHNTTRFSLIFSLGSSWCHVPRISAERGGTGRRDSANPRRTREPNEKRNANCWYNLKSATRPLPAQTNISQVSYTSATNSLCCMLTTMCFFCKQCGAVNAGGTLRLLKSLCDGTGESRQKARRKLGRGLMPDEQVYGRWEARKLIAAQFVHDVAGCFDSARSVNLISHQKLSLLLVSCSFFSCWLRHSGRCLASSLRAGLAWSRTDVVAVLS